tara:strand:- start:296 stop:1765 length:1470 start_codon:yes stop_codon:yes gene_type:complete
MNSLGKFSITPQESLDFARASGDYNPLHLDPVAARRTRFGHTLIHGVCGTIRALDLLLRRRGSRSTLASIKVKYNKPATQGQELEAFEQTTDGVTRIELYADGTRCQVIDIEFAQSPAPSPSSSARLSACDADQELPLDLRIEDCNGVSGSVALGWNEALMTSLFPNATRHLAPAQLAVLLASTRIVGMKCPGLHSVFARLEIDFQAPATGTAARENASLVYRALSTDPRIDRVELELLCTGVQGRIEAFFRPPPVRQATFDQIATLVSGDEFSQQKALVIGGSRGLGEVISKVLAAGGAQMMITYAAGRDDALAVADDIGQNRAMPAVAPYNVIEGTLGKELQDFCASVTHIYYLASPTISKSDGKRWDRPLFTRYCDFYIDGLAMLLQQVMQHRDNSRELQVFIPSSVFLEQNIKGFDEYIAAKSAAEAYARCFEKNHRHCTVVAPRLPRLYTDQTSSIRNSDEQQTLTVIIDQLRQTSAMQNTALG